MSKVVHGKWYINEDYGEVTIKFSSPQNLADQYIKFSKEDLKDFYESIKTFKMLMGFEED